jgi:hypothetical protein
MPAKKDAFEALVKAVEDARKDGLDVRGTVVRMDDEGVSTTEKL